MELGTPLEWAEVGVETLLLLGSCTPLRASSDGVDASVAEEAMLLAEFSDGAGSDVDPGRFPRPLLSVPTEEARGVDTLFVPFGRGKERPSCCGSGICCIEGIPEGNPV
jgi:hypothetical protein